MPDDPVFWTALVNNMIYAAATIPASVALALLMAVLFNSKLKGRTFARVTFFNPTVLPMVTLTNLWLYFYVSDYGLIDRLLGLAAFDAEHAVRVDQCGDQCFPSG